MPRCDGIEASKRIIAIMSKVAHDAVTKRGEPIVSPLIVAMTANDTPVNRLLWQTVDVKYFLAKPPELADLKVVLELALGRAVDMAI